MHSVITRAKLDGGSVLGVCFRIHYSYSNDIDSQNVKTGLPLIIHTVLLIQSILNVQQSYSIVKSGKQPMNSNHFSLLLNTFSNFSVFSILYSHKTHIWSDITFRDGIFGNGLENI